MIQDYRDHGIARTGQQRLIKEVVEQAFTELELPSDGKFFD